MSLRYLLDTSTLSLAIAAKPNRRVVERLSQRSQHCAIAAPVWHELVYGFERMPVGKRRDEIEAFLESVVGPSFPVLPYDEAAAAWHGAERARLERSGRGPPLVDGQIAAIAAVGKLALVTANARDFVRFGGLKVEDWSKR